jgi:hypothetical protein
MKNFIYILLLIVITSCATSKKKCIEKYCTNDTTTIVVRDTIYTESVKHDTTFSERIDSVFIQKDKLRIIYKKRDSIITIEGECLSDTIYYTKTIEVPHVIEKPFEFKWWIYLLIFFSGTFFALFVTKK